MNDNPQDSLKPVFSLPDHHLITLTGRDAAAFAQAQFMNDLDLLEPGQWQWNGWLTPTGHVIALFALLRFDLEHLWLLLPDANPVDLVTALQRSVFRHEVTITVRPDLHVEGLFARAATRGSEISGDAGNGVELDLGAEGGARALRIRPATAAPEDAAKVARWALFDLEHGLPRLPPSQARQWTPQQLSLQRLRAFSMKKSGYPGQEAVAQTLTDKTRRGLALFECDTALPVGAEVTADAELPGQVIASIDADGRHVAQAVLPLERESQPHHADSARLEEIRILQGLAR